jgi:hypothetical protein
MTSHFIIAHMVFWEDAVWKSLCPEIFQQCDLSKVLEDCKECETMKEMQRSCDCANFSIYLSDM